MARTLPITRLDQIKVQISRALNWVLGGHHDQMLSSRLHEKRHWTRHIVNMLFFNRNHCRAAYLWETLYAKNNSDDEE